MTEESRSYPLVSELIKRSRLPWYWAAVVVTGVLFLLLILAAFLDGVLSDVLGWEFWHSRLIVILLVTYILAVYEPMRRLRDRAVEAFRPLLSLDDKDFNRLAAEVNTPKRRWEWASALAGVAFALVLGQPWTLEWGPGLLWQSVHLVIVGTLMNSLLAWLIYDTVTGAVRVNRLSRRDLKLDVLDTGLLTPIARWSLGISFGFVGGTSLSLVFATRESLLKWQSISMYAILVCVTVLIFLLSMWSFHRAMTDAKNRKLALARKRLITISRELEDYTEQGQLGGLGELSASLTSWSNYQRLVRETPTWPFDAGIIRRLLASAIVPAIVYLIKILAGVGLRF
jgi:hypothetical protein